QVKADQARGVPLETLRRRLNAGVARENALNARIQANNQRSSALSARIGPYNEAVVRNNTRRNREQFGPLNELRAQLDRALDAWFEARLAEHAQALAARAAEAGWTPQELEREVAWTRWLFGGGSSGPALGSF